MPVPEDAAGGPVGTGTSCLLSVLPGGPPVPEGILLVPKGGSSVSGAFKK